MYNFFTPSVSFFCFRPALLVPLGGRVDIAGCWGGALCAVVPAPRDARQTLIYRRLQVLLFGPSGRNGAGLCWGASSTSASTALSSTAAPDGALCLEGSEELRIYCHELCREPLDRGIWNLQINAITCRGRC